MEQAKPGDTLPPAPAPGRVPMGASITPLPTEPSAEQFMIDDLARSGITATEMDATVERETFSGRAIGYRIPYYLPNGALHPIMHRVRLMTPTINGGKYSQPDKATFADGTYPYLPRQNAQPFLRGPALIVEGEKKTIAAIRYLHRIAYGIGGCWNWSQTMDDGTHRLHPLLAERFMPGSFVEVVFDGDLLTNMQVQTAAGTLRRRLREIGVQPVFVLLPRGKKGAAGLDDWINNVRATGVASVQDAFDKLPRTSGIEFMESSIDAWSSMQLVMSANDIPVNNESNVLRVLKEHEWFKGLRFNSTMKRMEFTPPQGKLLENDAIELHATVFMQERLGMARCTSAPVRNALALLCSPDSPLAYNEVGQHLRNQASSWDGAARVDTFLVRVLHLPDTPYHRAVSRAFFIGAARRAIMPGCKMDYVMILAGKGGVGKTTFFQRIAMRAEWVKEITEGLDRSKDARMALSRGWIVEASEGVAFDMASAGGMKAVITDTCDEFRPPYAASMQRFPRQTVIVASTNDETLLKYEGGSGNRRFLPITLRGSVDFTTLDAEIAQVWGEATTRMLAGEREWTGLTPGGPDLETLAEDAVRAHTEVDPWVDDLALFLEDPTHLKVRTIHNVKGVGVSSYDLLSLALRLDPERKIAAHGKRLRRAMAAVGGGWQHVVSSDRLPDGSSRKWTGYWKQTT